MVLRVIGLLSHSLPGSRSLCQPRRHAQCYPADRQAACLAAALALHLRDLPPQHSPSQQPRKVGNSLALPLLRVCERPPSHLVNRINASGNCRREQFKQLQHFTYRYKLCEKSSEMLRSESDAQHVHQNPSSEQAPAARKHADTPHTPVLASSHESLRAPWHDLVQQLLPRPLPPPLGLAPAFLGVLRPLELHMTSSS